MKQKGMKEWENISTTIRVSEVSVLLLEVNIKTFTDIIG